MFTFAQTFSGKDLLSEQKRLENQSHLKIESFSPSLSLSFSPGSSWKKVLKWLQISH